MKKVFLTLALVATVLVSCKHVNAPAKLTTTDSTSVQVDLAQVDSTTVSDDEARDYLKDTVK